MTPSSVGKISTIALAVLLVESCFQINQDKGRNTLSPNPKLELVHCIIEEQNSLLFIQFL